MSGPWIVTNAACGWPIECGLTEDDGTRRADPPGILFFAHGVLAGRPALFELEAAAHAAVARTLAWGERWHYGWRPESYQVHPVAAWEADQDRRRGGAGLPRARSR